MEQVYPFRTGFVALRAFFPSMKLIILKEEQLYTGLETEINGLCYAQGEVTWQEGTVMQTPLYPGRNSDHTEVNTKPLLTAVRLGLHPLDHSIVSVPGGSLLPRIMLCLLCDCLDQGNGSQSGP